MKACYDENDTMRLLGKQKICFIYRDGIRKQINDIVIARPYSVTPDMAIDLFMLGYIHGKRAERARRKK